MTINEQINLISRYEEKVALKKFPNMPPLSKACFRTCFENVLTAYVAKTKGDRTSSLLSKNFDCRNDLKGKHLQKLEESLFDVCQYQEDEGDEIKVPNYIRKSVYSALGLISDPNAIPVSVIING